MRFIIVPICFIFIIGCQHILREHQFPNPVDTSGEEVEPLVKNTFRVNENITIDNQFDGARFNSLHVINDSTVTITTEPENEPINSSPWYAYRVVTNDNVTNKNLTVSISYSKKHKHRYWPNFSNDRKNWTRLDSSLVHVSADTLTLSMKLSLDNDTLWVAAQPIVSSKDVLSWCMDLSARPEVIFQTAGYSVDQRPLPFLKIGYGNKAIIVLSRQHPPEVTGFFALQFFLDEILTNGLSQEFLENHTLLVYPLMNPDGVDMGHWRHNASGVDLNRDWSYYRQPEVSAVANHIVNTINDQNLDPMLGLDFHSTWYDVYYTTDRSIETVNRSFTDHWFDYIESKIENYAVKDAPSGLRAPVSKGWFVSQFNIPGITYEIGDNTSIEFNKEKSAVAAEGLMVVLMK